MPNKKNHSTLWGIYVTSLIGCYLYRMTNSAMLKQHVIHAPNRYYFPQKILRNTSHESKAITDWLIRKHLSQWPSSLHRGTELTQTTISLNSVKFHQFPNIWHRNLVDITTDVHLIIKVKDYRFHVPIYHIFWELQSRSYQNASKDGCVPVIGQSG
jgi:hypothetical protein